MAGKQQLYTGTNSRHSSDALNPSIPSGDRFQIKPNLESITAGAPSAATPGTGTFPFPSLFLPVFYPTPFPVLPAPAGPGRGRGSVRDPLPAHLPRAGPSWGHIWRHIWAGAAPPRGHIWRRRGAAQRRGGRSGGRRSPAAGRGGQSRRGAEGRERRPDGAAGPQPGPAPAAAAAGAGARLDLPGGAAGRRQVGEVPSSMPSLCSSPCHPPPGLVINFCALFFLQGGLLRE